MRVDVSKRPQPEKVTADDMQRIRSDLRLLTNQTKALGKHIRSAFGSRNSTEPYLREKLQLVSHQVDDIFTYEVHQFDSSASKASSSLPVVYCTDIEALKDRIVTHRHPQGGVEVDSVIGLDGGGGFLKICVTFRLPHDPSSESTTVVRSKLSDGVAERNLKDTSVRKLFVIAIVPDAKETYRNVLLLWNLLKLTSPQTLHPFTCCMDLKLANTTIGLMAHACSHPCTWCNSSKENLDSRGELRTLGSVRRQYWSFVDSEKDTKNAKHFGNCIHSPIFKGPDTTEVIDIIPPPELHLMLGAVNLLFVNFQKKWPDVLRWASSLNVEREAIHGGAFAGNACRKLLKNVDLLQELAPIELRDYVRAFRALNDVVLSCFGKTLQNDYKEKIDVFNHCFQALGLQVTPKIHAILFHVIDFCDRKETGLGMWSEQAFESVHADFTHVWQKYKVPTTHERFADRFLRSVQEYNGNHF